MTKEVAPSRFFLCVEGVEMVNWKIDEAAAGELDGMGIKWKEGWIEHEDIDVSDSRENGARSQRLDESAVVDYRECMERGDVFPMIVVCKINGRGKFVIAGGNHRHAALASVEKSAFPVMGCSVSAVQFAILCRRLNRANGKRETRADRVKHAAQLVKVYGLDQRAAAEAMDIPRSTLGTELRAAEVRQIIAGLTGDDCSEVPSSVLVSMGKYKSDHNVLRELAGLSKAGVGLDEMRSLVRKLKELPTEAAKVEMLSAVHEQRKKKTVGGREVSMKIAASFRRMTTQIENIIAKGKSCKMQMEAAELGAIAKRMAAMAEAVQAMATGRE